MSLLITFANSLILFSLSKETQAKDAKNRASFIKLNKITIKKVFFSWCLIHFFLTFLILADETHLDATDTSLKASTSKTLKLSKH